MVAEVDEGVHCDWRTLRCRDQCIERDWAGARIGAKGSPRIAHRLVPFPDADRSKDPPIRDLLGETVAMVLAPTWRSARRS